MKLLVVLSLTSVALGGMDYEMVQKWQKLKAMESCWGEENMKLVMVDMKKAIAKCSHEDAPELSLPPYRSSYRFVNTMINKGDNYENIDIQAMKRDIQKYTMPSEWFKNKYEHLLDTCYEMATNLPADIAENSVVTGDSFGTVKLGEVKMFTKCCEKAKTKLCMHQDIKKKVESNFGPMEDILQETQLTEHEFFPLVMQLLHGKEMDYMTGGM